MKGRFLLAILTAATGLLFAQSPKDFVGTWKSDPGTPPMTRKLELDGNVIVMTEIQPGRNGGPAITVIRKYPTDGSEVTMDSGIFAGATATGKMVGKVLTVDTTMKNGAKFHDVWTLSDDKQHYTNEMVISGLGRGGAGRGQGQGGSAKGGGQGGQGQAGEQAPTATRKFSYTRQ